MHRTLKRSGVAVLLTAIGASLLGVAPAVAQETDDGAGGGLTAGIFVGACDGFDAEPRFALAGQTASGDDDADDQGSGAYTDVAAPMDSLIGEPNVIAVMSDDDRAVVCGEITRNSLADGGVAVGLVERGASGLSGLAYLSDDGERTGVSLFLATGLIEAEDDGAGREDEAVDGNLGQATVNVYGGSCETRGDDALLTFERLNLSDDDDVGISVASLAVSGDDDDFRDDDLSAVVGFGEDEGTCGDVVKGPAQANGTVVVGLRERDDSDVTGFVVLEADDDGSATLFLAEDLGEDDAGQQESAELAPADDDGASADDDDDSAGTGTGSGSSTGTVSDDDGSSDDDAGGGGVARDDDGADDDDDTGTGTGGGSGGDDDDDTGGTGGSGGGDGDDDDDGGGDDDGGDD